MHDGTDVFYCFDQFDNKVLNDIVVDPHVFMQLFVDPSVCCQSCTLQAIEEDECIQRQSCYCFSSIR